MSLLNAELPEQDSTVNTPDVNTNVEASESTPAESSTPSHTFHWDDGVGATGDVPEWFKYDKYKSVAEQAKAYAELESKIGGFTGAPEKYEMSLDKDAAEKVAALGFNLLDENDPFFSNMVNTAKELNMSQEGFNKLASKFVEAQIAQEDNRVKGELAALGADANRIVTKINTWAKDNLSEDECKYLEGACTTANGVRFAEMMLNKLQGEPNISHKEVSVALSKAEIQAMQAKPEYKTDSSFRAKVSEEWERYFKANPQ